MKWPDIKDKSETELTEALRAARSQLVDLRFRAGSGALKQVRQIRTARQIISRILTRLSQISKAT